MSKFFVNKQIWFFLILPYLFLVAIHLVFSSFFDFPRIFYDEFIYLSQVRIIAGGNPIHFFMAPYGHFGYSIFLAPIFWIFDDVTSIYKGVLFLNAFLISSLYFLFYYILRVIFEQKKQFAMATALVVSFFPGIFLRANTAMTENIFIPLFILTLILFYNFLQKKSYLSIAWLSLSSVLLYAVHLRGAVMLWAILIVLWIWYFFNKKYLKKVFLASILTLVGFKGVQILNEYFLSISWIRLADYSLSDIFISLLNFGVLKNYLLGITGQFLYLVYSTYGLFLIGLFFSINYIYKKTNFEPKNLFSNDKVLFVGFSVLISLLYFGLASFIAIQTPDLGAMRADKFLHGRYNETFLPIFIAFGFWALYQGRKYSNKILFPIIFFPAVLVAWGLWDILNNNIYGYANIFGLIPLLNSSPWPALNLVFWTLFTMLILLIINTKFLYDFWPKLLIIFTLFTSLTIFMFIKVEIPDYRQEQKSMHRYYYDLSNGIDKLSYLDALYFDVKGLEGINPEKDYYKTWRKNFLLLQYYYPDIKFEVFDPSKDDISNKQAVIVDCQWSDPNMEKIAQVIINKDDPKEGKNCQTLWVSPDLEPYLK